ncbi:unnamed protein product [Sympodiomycopsis kandeliae]
MEDNRLAVDTRGIILSQLPSLDTDAEGGHSKDPRGGSQLKKHERGLHRQSAILYLYRQQTNNHQQHQQQQHHHQHQQPTTNTFVVDKLEAVIEIRLWGNLDMRTRIGMSRGLANAMMNIE